MKRDGIPERWLNGLAWRDHIEQRAVDLFQAGANIRHEPPRVCRGLISSNHAAMSDCSSAA